MNVDTPRLLLCRHCKVWYTVNRVRPDVCPTCEQKADWVESPVPVNYPQPFRLSVTDRDFLRVNKIQPWDEDDDDAA